MSIERPYKFTDNSGREYNFGIASSVRVNESLEVKKIIYVHISCWEMMPFLKTPFAFRYIISESFIKNKTEWRSVYSTLPEEFRLHLLKFIKQPAFF